MKKYILLVIISASIFTSILTFSQTIPQTINYQGLLKDASGVVVANGDYNLTFKMYDVESSGSPLWTETKLINIVDGIINTQLGSITPITLPFNEEYWLGITIAAGSELTPRIKFASVPYSFMSMNVPDASLTAGKIADGQVVKSINSLTDDVNLIPGSNISIIPSGNNLTISSTGGGGLTLPYSETTSNSGYAISITNTDDSGILGTASNTSGLNFGLYGSSASTSGRGIWGFVSATTGSNVGVGGGSQSSTGIGVYGVAGSSSGTNYAIRGITNSPDGYSGYFSGGKLYVSGNVGIGVMDPEYKLHVTTNDLIAGYFGTDAATGVAYGISAYSNSTEQGAAVRGDGSYVGIWGSSTGRWGVYGRSEGTSNSYGVYGSVTTGSGNYAGYFSGNVGITGTLTKVAGSFKIDHPLDPQNKYLYHSFVESPDMKNIYDGTIVLDNNGEATVQLPDWFEALNKDFRYQLTCIGSYANVYIAEKINNNKFKIAGGTQGLEVSWQVTGIRHDAYAENNRIPVEELKNTDEQGKYLYPEGFGLSREYSVDFQPKNEKINKIQNINPKTADGNELQNKKPINPDGSSD